MTATAFAEFVKVSKDYPEDFFGRRKLPAVREVSFRIEPGEVFGLIGPNRAGKTTLVKMLLSLSRPSAGDVLRFGVAAADRRTLARIGYMHEAHAFPRYLTASGLLAFYGALTLLPPEHVAERVPGLLRRVELDDRSHEAIARFSKGMIQRLALAQALLGEPDLLVLDEPSEGLDLAGRKLLREVVEQQREQGRSVLLVSHVLTEVEKLCDRIGVIYRGKLIYLGPLDDLLRGADEAPRPLEHVLQELYREKAPK